MLQPAQFAVGPPVGPDRGNERPGVLAGHHADVSGADAVRELRVHASDDEPLLADLFFPAFVAPPGPQSDETVPATCDELLAWLEPTIGEGLVVRKWRNSTRDLERFCAAAAIQRCTSNDLRRTFASWLKQDGVDSMTVAQLMGHCSTAMVERVYGRLSMETYRNAVNRLPQRRIRRVK